MQEADSEHCTACKSRTPNANVELVDGSYWIVSSMIALFENVNRMTKISRSGEGKKKKTAVFLGLFVTRDTLSRALRDEQHMFT